MKNLLTNLVLLLLTIPAFSQYQVGVPVLETIYSGQYNKISDCTPNEDVNVGFDSEVVNYPTGLQVMMVITEINIPQGTLSYDEGILAAGDSLSINADNNLYTFFLASAGNFKFEIIAKGIPQIAGESYPCDLGAIVTLADCQNGYEIIPADLTEYCEVEIDVASKNLISAGGIRLFPNPSSGIFTINNLEDRALQSISIFDSMGRLISTTTQEEYLQSRNLQLANAQAGLYMVRIEMEQQIISKRVILRN